MARGKYKGRIAFYDDDFLESEAFIILIPEYVKDTILKSSVLPIINMHHFVRAQTSKE